MSDQNISSACDQCRLYGRLDLWPLGDCLADRDTLTDEEYAAEVGHMGAILTNMEE